MMVWSNPPLTRHLEKPWDAHSQSISDTSSNAYQVQQATPVGQKEGGACRIVVRVTFAGGFHLVLFNSIKFLFLGSILGIWYNIFTGRSDVN